MVAQRRAAGLDRVVEHRLDAVDQPLGALVRRARSQSRWSRRAAWATAARGAAPRRHRCCRARRPRAGRAARPSGWSSCRRRRAPASRRRTRCRAAPGRARAAAAPASSSARGTSFIEPKRRGSLKVTIARRRHVEHDVVVREVLASARDDTAPGVCSLLAAQHAERARHAEMHQQHVAGGEIGEQILGAPAEPARRSGPRAARRNPSAAASADRRGAPRPARSARPPSPAPGRGARSRLRAVRAWSTGSRFGG